MLILTRRVGDIVMIGGATHNIKWYENMGEWQGR